MVRELEEVFPLRQSLLPAAVEAAAADGEDLVLLTDATDVFFNYPVSTLRARYAEVAPAGGVVLASEMSCWVDRMCSEEDERRVFPNSSGAPTASRYVNAGGLVGPPRAVLDFLAALPAYQDALAEIYTVSLDASNTPVYSSQIAFCGEQCAVAQLARDAAGSGTVTVDHRQRLFGSPFAVFGSSWGVLGPLLAVPGCLGLNTRGKAFGQAHLG